MVSGEVAALVTALMWSFTSLLFSAAAERIGTIALNAIRITIALGLIGATHAILYGGLAFHTDDLHLAYLAGSGLVGLVLGDLFYFRGIVLMGPKRAALVMTLWPATAALIAWAWLSEVLIWPALAGIALTLSGIAWSILGRRKPIEPEPASRLLFGIAFCVIGAFGQAMGVVLAKKGFEVVEHELSGSLVRMAAACVVTWIVLLCSGPRKLADALGHRSGLGFATAGAVTGPYLGVWLSLYATTHGQLGVVSALMSTTPIFLIPLSAIFRKERPTLHEILGAVVAVGGVAVLLNSQAIIDLFNVK